MNKEQLIHTVEESGLDDNLKKTIILAINQAYDAGFSDGMVRGAELQSQVFDVILGKDPCFSQTNGKGEHSETQSSA